MPAYFLPRPISAVVVVVFVVAVVGPVPLRQPDPLHGGAGDQVHVSLALEAPHLDVAPQSLIWRQ